MASPIVFLMQALVIVAVPVVVLRILGLRGRVPLVVFQIVVGIALGPSLFGRLAPDYFHLFFGPAAVAPLSGIASVALVIFGLLTGLHFDATIFRRRGRATSLIAAANILLPALLGGLTALLILIRHPAELLPGIDPVVFIAAISICVAVTALPVLAEILREMNLLGRRIGDLALAVAGINDFVLYICLALLLTTVAAKSAGGAAVLVTVLLAPIYLIFMVRVVRSFLGKMVTVRMQDGEVRERALVVVGCVTIVSALVGEIIGVSGILGAFIAGAVMPTHLRKPILDRLQAPTLALLMPFFFTITGLRIQVEPESAAFLEIFIVATLASVVGIMGGTALGARLARESWPFALGLGALLQTKGLLELVVLTILLDARIISANTFSALILMAVVCTAVAMPLARFILRRDREAQPGDLRVLGVDGGSNMQEGLPVEAHKCRNP